MPREVADDDEWDDDEGEYLPDDDEQDDTIACPHCGSQIYEDAQRCPVCEHYLSEEDHPASPKSLWIVVGFVLAGLISLMWIFT